MSGPKALRVNSFAKPSPLSPRPLHAMARLRVAKTAGAKPENKKPPPDLSGSGSEIGGPYQVRTGDLRNAIAALCQLS